MKLTTLKPTLLITLLTLTMATIGCSKAEHKDSNVQQKATENTVAINQSDSNSDNKQPSQAQAQQQADHLVIVKSFKAPTLEQGKAIDKLFKQLQQQGFKPYFIKTDNYPPLKKGLWAMVLGEFDKATADSKQAKVKKLVSDAYVRQVDLPDLKLTPIDEDFAYAQTSIGTEENCFIANEDGANEDWHEERYCLGTQGHSIKIDVQSVLTELYVDNQQLDIHIGSSEEFDKYPVAWIYSADNPQQLLAVSFVVEDGSSSKRHLFVLKNGKFVQANKTFAVKGLNKVANYLNENVIDKGANGKQAMAVTQADHLVIVKSFKAPTLKQAKAIDKQFKQLQQQGFKPYFIKTDDYPPLKKGLWAMVLGGFDKATATAKQTQVKQWVADAYIRKIEPPKLTPIGKEFTYHKTYLDDKKACFTFKEGEDHGVGFIEQYCAGIQGHRISASYSDGYMFLFIDNKELDIYVGSNMIFVPENQPVAWIYHQDNPQQLLAVSMVLVDLNEVDDITDDNKVKNVSKRHLFVVKDGKFIRVNKTFAVDGLDKVAEYLSNGVKDSDLVYQEEEDEEIEEETTETDGIEDEETPYNQKTKYGITVIDCQFDLDKDNFCSDERMQTLAKVMAERQPNFDKDKILYIFKGVDDNIVSFPVEMYRVVVLDKKNKTARPLRYALGQATDIDNNPVQINDKGDTLEYQFDINSDKFCFIGNIYAYRDSYTYDAENYPKFCFINDEGLIKSF